MMEWLANQIWIWDLQILHYFNVTHADPTMDQIWRHLTQIHKQAWFLYGLLPLLLVSLFYKYRTSALGLLFALGVAIALSDGVSYRVIKQAVERQRPFQNPETSVWVRKVGQAHGPSFPSNHAANTFAGAVVLAWYFPRRRYIFYTIAGLVSLSRVTLGVHFPSDVVVGALLGILVGVLVRFALLNKCSWFWLKERVSHSHDDSGDWRTRSRRLSQP